MDEAVYRVVRSAGAALPGALRAVDRVLGDPDTRILKDVARTTVGVVAAPGGALVLKRFRPRGPLHLLEGVILGSDALHVWRAAARLRRAGVAVPEAVAVLERRRLGVAVRSCVLTRWVAGRALDELWRARRGAARRALTVALADYLRHLHAHGLYPQDLRGANVIVAGEDPPRFVLVDLDRVRRHRRLGWRRRMKNIVQLHRSVARGAPRADALRFLVRYLGPVSRAELRRAVDQILRFSARKDDEYWRRRGELPPHERVRPA